MRKVFLGLLLLPAITACAPQGYSTAGYKIVQWPTSEQTMTAASLVEIESLLNRLGYAAGPADGLLTRQSRIAITAFKADVGVVPVNGAVSAFLLDALRYTAGGVRAAPATVAPSATRPGITPAPSGGSGGSSGGQGGGAGGGGGNPWG